MANSYFQFKEFTVHQDRAAMKVSTDACLFGASVADICSEWDENYSVLDIGTGTGLLSLMLAQQFKGLITGVDIDPAATQQASENFAASPWASRLRAVHKDIREFHGDYDFIIANPPFYSNDLKSPDYLRNQARHSDTLDLEELFDSIRHLLTPNGTVAILIPFHRLNELIANASEFICWNLILVRQTPNHKLFRAIVFLSYANPDTHPGLRSGLVGDAIKELTIQEQGAYTPEVLKLLKPYYLNL